MFSIRHHIRDQIDFIDNSKEKEYMENICDGRKFLFTYNNITDRNPNPGHKIEKFLQG